MSSIKSNKIHILLIIARGEAVRNFVYTDFLENLSKKAKVSILTQINHPDLINTAKNYGIELFKLRIFKENRLVILFREIIHTAHYRHIWTEAVKYYWGRHDLRVKGNIKEYIRLKLWRILSYPFANSFMLEFGTILNRYLTLKFRSNNYYDRFYKKIKPDIVFNCSHIHGPGADFPVQVAAFNGIPTSVFLFSWDNLTSRGRIFPKYDKYFVWTTDIKNQLISLYNSKIFENQVIVTGTPQFDFHFQKKHKWTREKLYEELGLDANRPFILYSTGMASDFPFEHKIIEGLISYIKNHKNILKPQLVVRTYIKGNSDQVINLSKAYKNDNDIIFPTIFWDKKYIMPEKKDIRIYSNILRYCILGINTASTVSLELMMFRKPVVNIGFEPPGSNLDSWTRYSRHIDYEHYLPVVKGKGVKVARSMKEMISLIDECLNNRDAMIQYQEKFLKKMFNNAVDDKASKRIANALLK